MGKDLEGSCRGIILRYYFNIYLQGLRKITKNLSQDSRSPGRDLNLGPPANAVIMFKNVLKHLLREYVRRAALDTAFQFSVFVCSLML
jgi:hypothetical protein